MKLGISIGSGGGNKPRNFFTGQAPTISNSGGTVGAYDPVTRTMSNSGAVVAGYPRFQFALGLTPGVTYTASGQITGNFNQISPIRLANTGSANNLTYSTITGVLSGSAVSLGDYLEIVTNLDGAETATIANLAITRA